MLANIDAVLVNIDAVLAIIDAVLAIIDEVQANTGIYATCHLCSAGEHEYAVIDSSTRLP